ncbi:MAG: DEAD/DEAH box helicase [Christensenellaceae bacterium]|nr:DEAD/DEAH box helicase [Christensenellaceae bacterium]
MDIPYQLRAQAGEEETQAGERLYLEGHTRVVSQSAKAVECMVEDRFPRRVVLTPGKLGFCGCPTCDELGACRHIIAATLAAQESGAMEPLRRRQAILSGPKLLAAMESSLPEQSAVRLEVTLQVNPLKPGVSPKLRVGLRIGEDRLYAVRSIPQMIEAIETGEPIEYGKGFAFHPAWMRFSPAEKRVIDILRALCLAQKDSGLSLRLPEQRFLALPEPFAEALLSALTFLPFRVAADGKALTCKRVRQARIPLYYRVSSDLRGLSIAAHFPKDFRPLTASCTYAIAGGMVVQVEDDQRAVMRVLWQEQYGGRCGFDFPAREADRVISELVPFLKLTGVVEIAEELERQLIRMPLTARIYLDRADRDVVARVQFRYGDQEIDPFDEKPAPEIIRKSERILLRDAAAERRVLDALGTAGFYVSRGHVYLTGQDNIFTFVSEGVQKLQELCEVYLSNDFRRFQPHRPSLTGRMRMRGGVLELQFTMDGEPAPEILAILEALSHHRRYFRLKDGAFLDLSALDAWQPLADSVSEAASLENADISSLSGDTITLQGYRTAYLHSLLETAHLPITVDESVTQAVQALSEPPAVRLPAGLSLRPYQQRGFQWLYALDRLHMGGVLADDMGLGKTVQIIALLLATRQPGQTSLVVAPTTLTYNWLSELRRFAPDLSAMVISGTAAQRASQISHVLNARDIDVLITSYPLIRQDIDLLSGMDFRFAILDEAQHIKNAGSKAALAVKQLKARTRFALTGTPMENGIGELWSIFDFVLPGYLLGYGAFLRRYQDGADSEDLRRRIRPFLMRRLKKDVLPELPDKLERVLTAQMTPEQSKVYQAAMLRLRDRVDNVLRQKGFERGRTEVLAAITQLREVCCHPSLVLDGYTGSSGKLDLLLDLLPTALSSGRRLLVFSAFTSMLKIIRRRLEETGYQVLYLDGDTPAAQRLEMTEAFNAGQGEVFLISLKAGGTGLNLTGADMVVHYDPWWNPAAEDQATDRAHRIGQTHKVDVLRLVTHDSIEEKVIELGLRKRALFDQLITPGEQLVSALSPQEILGLFQ